MGNVVCSEWEAGCRSDIAGCDELYLRIETRDRTEDPTPAPGKQEDWRDTASPSTQLQNGALGPAGARGRARRRRRIERCGATWRRMLITLSASLAQGRSIPDRVPIESPDSRFKIFKNRGL